MGGGRTSGNKSLQLRQAMLPEIQDNCPGKIVGIDSEAVVANTCSEMFGIHSKEKNFSGVYLLCGTEHYAVSLKAECFVLQTSRPHLVCVFYLSLLTGS